MFYIKHQKLLRQNFAIISHRYTILPRVGNFIKKKKFNTCKTCYYWIHIYTMLLKILTYIEEEEETREKPWLMHKQTKTSHANCCEAY
jgi:hypothetical protein